MMSLAYEVRDLARSILAAALLSAAFNGTAAAQSYQTEERPLALLDSTYAIRVELARIVNEIRTGDRTGDLRARTGSELASEVARLATAAASRRCCSAPRPELGAAWDFTLDSLQFEAMEANRVRATAKARMTTNRRRGRDVTLSFRRVSSDWVLENADALAAALKGVVGDVNAESSRP